MALTRKKPEDKSQVWRPRRSVDLYLDDVDELLFVIKDLGELNIETEDFTGTVHSANELREVLEGENLSDLRLEVPGTDRALSLNVAPEMILTISPRDDLLLRGAGDKIKDIVNARMHRLGGLPPSEHRDGANFIFPSLALVAALVGVITAVLSFSQQQEAQPELDYWTLILGTLGYVSVLTMLAIGWAILGTNPHPSGKLRLVFESEAPGWWKENRSAVLLGLLTNAVVGAVFFTLGLLVGG